MHPQPLLRATPLAGLVEVHSTPHTDARGAFTRLYCASTMADVTAGAPVVQINQSRSITRGTLRGLHFQRSPCSDGKLVRCLRGRVFDVAVDLRTGSPSFAQWHALELSAENARALWIPPGFAHGFQTLADDSELLYLHTAEHSPAHEGGLRWDDPALAIPWPLPPQQLSPRDQALPWLSNSPIQPQP